MPSRSSNRTDWSPSSIDAGWLTGQLRSSRLTVLCGDADAAMTELLRGGVLPRLQRRAEDRRQAPPGPSAQILNFPDRRAAGLREAEVCVYFAEWDEAPRQALTRALREAVIARGADPEAGCDLPLQLVDKLKVLARGAGLRFLIVLDGFEACLNAPPERGDLRALREEIFAALNEPDLPAQFLLTLHEDDVPLLESLRGRVIGFDAVRQPLPTGEAGTPTSPGRLAAGPARPAAPQTEAVYASIEDWLAKAASRSAEPEAAPPVAPPSRQTIDQPPSQAAAVPAGEAILPPEPEPVVAVEPAFEPEPALEAEAAAASEAALEFEPETETEPEPEPIAAQPQAAASPFDQAAEQLPDDDEAPAEAERRAAPWRDAASRVRHAARAAAARGGSGLSGRLPWLLGLVVLLVGLGVAVGIDEELELAGVDPALESGPAGLSLPSRPGPAPSLVLGGGDLLAGRMGEDLSRALASGGGAGVALQASRGWREDLNRLQGGTRLAIARDDALRAVREDGSTGPLRIVMPLVSQELAFVVRADSPLRHIHEVEGRRINIGPADGARALTVRTAYRSLFGQELPLARASLAGETAALDELLNRSVDVVVLVGNAPAPWATAWPEMIGGLRLLALRADHPSSRRALRTMRPGSLDAGPKTAATPTLAVMSFLVTGEPGPLHAGLTSDTAAPDELARIAAALCRQLPTLQRDGHPKWRELRPDRQLEVGWPYADEAQRALRGCVGAERPPAKPASPADTRPAPARALGKTAQRVRHEPAAVRAS